MAVRAVDSARLVTERHAAELRRRFRPVRRLRRVLRHYGVQPSTGGAVGLPKFYGKDEDRNEKLPDTPTGIA